MITCPKCSKDNQDHYKFCLGCGAELPRDVAPKPFSPQTPPHGMRAAGAVPAAPAAPVAAAPAGGSAAFGGTVAIPGGPGRVVAFAQPAVAPLQATAAAPLQATAAALAPNAQAPAAVAAVSPAATVAVAEAATMVCPQCGHRNTASNLFCGSCGFRLAAAAPRPPVVAPAPEATSAGLSLTALRADGSEAGTYQLPAGGSVGRETGGIFAGDSYLSPRHATFRSSGAGRAIVKDEGSLNGVYKKLGRDLPVELKINDVFRIGQEIVKYEALTAQPPTADGVERLGAPSKGYVGRIALVIGRDDTGNAFPIPESGIHLGRERGDILFPEDGYVSGLHCRLSWDGQRLFLTDLGSSNGTFLRITSETEVRTGDVLLMGQQLFRVTI